MLFIKALFVAGKRTTSDYFAFYRYCVINNNSFQVHSQSLRKELLLKKTDSRKHSIFYVSLLLVYKNHCSSTSIIRSRSSSVYNSISIFPLRLPRWIFTDVPNRSLKIVSLSFIKTSFLTFSFFFTGSGF